MTGFKLRAAGLAALFFSTLAFAAPPAAPGVTVGAGLKQLRFDVEPVSGASFYRLWFRANGGAEWVKYAETTSADPLFKVTVSTHLIDWYNARYKVSACNSSGCGTTSDIYVTNYLRDTVGYFKPRAGAISPMLFGQEPALSADGKTLAVVSGEMIGPRQNSLTVAVFRKGASGWVYEATLLPTPVEANTGQRRGGQRLAVNGDGTVIAFGVPTEFTLPAGARGLGALYVFRRTGTTWAQEFKVKTQPGEPAYLGHWIDIDDAGDTVAVGREFDYPLEIYERGAGGWTLATTIVDENRNCKGFALSGDGKFLARSCEHGFRENYVEIREAPAWAVRQEVPSGTIFSQVDVSYDGSLIATATGGVAPAGATWTSWAMVLRRTGATWEPDPAFTHVGKARNPPTGSGTCCGYGSSVAISRDGRFVAIGDVGNRIGGTGAMRGPFTITSEYSGAVFIYQRKPTAWALRNFIKPNVLTQNSQFGASAAFGDDGKVLAVGEYNEDSGARGIDGDQTDTSAPDSGAVWLY